jgi:hypothetical protein
MKNTYYIAYFRLLYYNFTETRLFNKDIYTNDRVPA